MSQTVFNLARPEDRERIDRHVALLAARTLRDLEALHYLETAEGWYCLDLNLQAPDEDTLDGLVRATIEATDDRIVLDAAELPLWMRMVNAPFLGQRVLSNICGPRARLVVATCSELFHAQH